MDAWMGEWTGTEMDKRWVEKLDVWVYKCVINGVSRRMVGGLRVEEINMGHYPHFYLFAGELQDKVNPESTYQKYNAQVTQ